MLQTLTFPSQNDQRTACSVESEFGAVTLTPEKHDRSRFDLRLNGRMWFGTVEQHQSCWGCVSNDAIATEESLEVLVDKILEAYIQTCSVSSPGFRAKLLA